MHKLDNNTLLDPFSGSGSTKRKVALLILSPNLSSKTTSKPSINLMTKKTINYKIGANDHENIIQHCP